MQFLYVNHISSSIYINSKIIENNLLQSVDKIYDLYICLINLLIALKNKANKKKNENRKINCMFFCYEKFADNIFLNILSKNIELSNYNKKNQQLTWQDKEGYINFLFKDFKNWPYYQTYINNNSTSFKDHKDFIIRYYKTYIKKNKKIRECLDDFYVTWMDDLDTVHDIVLNTLEYIDLNTKNSHCFKLYNVYKDQINKSFVLELYRKTLFNNKLFDNIISDTSTNWKLERIALLDRIILQMALCEFIFFPKIPPRVTINEYIEITKIYSTEKSKIFINGILNKIFKKLYNINI